MPETAWKNPSCHWPTVQYRSSRCLRISASPTTVLNVWLLRCSGDGLAIERANCLKSLRQDLKERVVQRTCPVVGIDAGHFLVFPVVFADFRRILNAAGAQHVLDRVAELCLEGRKRNRDRAVIGLHIQSFDFGLFGQPEGVRRIRPCDECVRIGGLRRLHHRRIVLCPERIRFVINDIEAGLLKDRASGVGEFDAERVRHVHDRDLVPDLAFVFQLLQHVDSTLRKRAGGALDEEQARIALRQRVDLVGDRRLRDLRIAVLGVDRRCGEVIAGAVHRHDEVDLILSGQPLHRLDCFARLTAVVVFDQLDLALAALHFEPAARVDLMFPQLEIRKVADRGAACHHAGARPDHSDLDRGILCPCGPEAEWPSQSRRASNFEYSSSMHRPLPEA